MQEGIKSVYPIKFFRLLEWGSPKFRTFVCIDYVYCFNSVFSNFPKNLSVYMIVQDLQRTVLISSSKKMNNIMVKLCSVSNMCLAAKDFRIFVTDWFRRDMTCTRLSIVSRLFHQFVHAVRSRGERHHMGQIFEFCPLKTFIFFDDML